MAAPTNAANVKKALANSEAERAEVVAIVESTRRSIVAA